MTDNPQYGNKQTQMGKIELDRDQCSLNDCPPVRSTLSSVTPFPLQNYISLADKTELKKQEVGRTIVLLQTGYEGFLTGHTSEKENMSREHTRQ